MQMHTTQSLFPYNMHLFHHTHPYQIQALLFVPFVSSPMDFHDIRPTPLYYTPYPRYAFGISPHHNLQLLQYQSISLQVLYHHYG